MGHSNVGTRGHEPQVLSDDSLALEQGNYVSENFTHPIRFHSVVKDVMAETGLIIIRPWICNILTSPHEALMSPQPCRGPVLSGIFLSQVPPLTLLTQFGLTLHSQ